MYRDLVRLQRVPGPYLAHYGVSKADGAKRGSGRYPLGSGERPNQHTDGYQRTGGEARSATRQLNKLDYKRANAARRARAAQSKVDDLRFKGVSEESNRFKKALSKAQIRESTLNKIEKKQASILKDMKDKGYTINSKEVLRMAEQGKTLVAYAIGGLPAALIYRTALKDGWRGEAGTKYKVGVNDSKETLNKAKKTGVYDEEFLTLTEPLGKMSESKLLSEYKSYLKDPQKYSPYKNEDKLINKKRKSFENKASAMRNRGMSYTDISENLGISRGAVWRLLNE